MRVNGLIDTGALLALLDRNDSWHRACTASYDEIRLPLGTSAAVLAELFHFLEGRPDHIRNAWLLLRSGPIRLLPIDDEDSAGLERLMSRYSDRPMGFADATLVHLAERESVSTVLTVDNGDFETYRIGKRKRFDIVPGRAARH